MDNSFFAYIQELELIAFFSGFPLIYVVILFACRSSYLKQDFKDRLMQLLSYGYALVGTLYVGLILRTLYPGYSLETIQNPYLTSWGILAVIFWIPALSKKTMFSLIHSLVIFSFLVKNQLIQLISNSPDINMVRNNMKIYTISLILNLGTFTCLLLLTSVLNYFTKKTIS
jgi:hypothetical protein